MAERVNITIDGAAYAVNAGMSVLQAALSVGVHIPHFCWHPALKVDGNCRMCQVEVTPGPPKPVIACATPVQEGLQVVTKSERIRETRKAVLSFLLLNHPLDCPVCDKAYECPLQEQTYDYGGPESWQWEAGLHDVKRRYARKDISDKIFIEMDRCIHCARCVRYFREKLGFEGFGRTLRDVEMRIDAVPRLPSSDFELNATDICPVGALGEKNFRFRARVWDLHHRPQVCPGCAVGCAVTVWSRQGVVSRVTPKINTKVNSYWLCDHGRLDFGIVNDPGRGTQPLVRDALSDPFRSATFDEACSYAASRLSDIRRVHGSGAVAAWVSPLLTSEELATARDFASRDLGGAWCGGLPGEDRHPVPDDVDADILSHTLVSDDPAPNSAGLRLLGLASSADPLREVVEGIEAGRIRALLMLGEDLYALDRAPGLVPASSVDATRLHAALARLDLLLAAHPLASTRSIAQAHVYLPTISGYEKRGSYVNRQGRVQGFQPAVTRADIPDARDELAWLSGLAQALDPAAPPLSIDGQRRRMAELAPIFAGLNWTAAEWGDGPVLSEAPSPTPHPEVGS